MSLAKARIVYYNRNKVQRKLKHTLQLQFMIVKLLQRRQQDLVEVSEHKVRQWRHIISILSHFSLIIIIIVN
jgi:hypothetical protein